MFTYSWANVREHKYSDNNYRFSIVFTILFMVYLGQFSAFLIINNYISSR